MRRTQRSVRQDPAMSQQQQHRRQQEQQQQHNQQPSGTFGIRWFPTGHGLNMFRKGVREQRACACCQAHPTGAGFACGRSMLAPAVSCAVPGAFSAPAPVVVFSLWLCLRALHLRLWLRTLLHCWRALPLLVLLHQRLRPTTLLPCHYSNQHLWLRTLLLLLHLWWSTLLQFVPCPLRRSSSQIVVSLCQRSEHPCH